MLRKGWGFLAVYISLFLLAACSRGPQPGEVKDEAVLAGRDVSSFHAADEDYFNHMDGGVRLEPAEIRGRNTWLVWSGGNDRFWDLMTSASVGNFDLLKTLSSYPYPKTNSKGEPNPQFGRYNRWQYLGLVNEPCFEQATGPDPNRYGLWLDKRKSDCGPDPFEIEKKYPGVQFGARGKNLQIGSFYGYASGVVGLRLFPNPNFDEAAARKWDPVRYYTDPDYYQQRDLIRPYRVGMACSFCHVGPNPVAPPAEPENPKWENLSSNVGAQYFWVDRIWSWPANPNNYIYQLLHTSRPGTLDTSLVSTDYINNPRSMNAVYGLGARLAIAKRWGRERLAGGGLNNKQFNDYLKEGPLTEFFQAPDTVWTPHVLKDGSDSVGALGALNRVYLPNIGVFSEEWLLHFNPLAGGKRISPIKISDAEQNSVYWKATEAQTADMARFFLKSTDPHHLKDAPDGAAYLTKDQAALDRGKIVFAERCARCHSSKLPDAADGLDPAGCAGPGYLECWNRYWESTKTEGFKRRMREIVMRRDFLDNNYLSADFRVPITLLQTNACSPLATNALAGNIWDNFSSRSYKQLPSVGSITIYDPFTGGPHAYRMPAGGRGYTRPPSLISVWSTAPFLQNNSLGKFDWRPSVEGRMVSFNDSIQQLLWPEKRKKDPVLGDKIPGVIDRTTTRSYLWVPSGYLPEFLQHLQGPLEHYFPTFFGDGGVKIGPIPEGTPVDLIANLNLVPDEPDTVANAAHQVKVAELLLRIKSKLEQLPLNATDEQARQVFAPLAPELLAVSKCPDFVVNRGHYFGTAQFAQESPLSDSDKYALIEYIKTF
jgi:hypothetical protein